MHTKSVDDTKKIFKIRNVADFFGKDLKFTKSALLKASTEFIHLNVIKWKQNCTN